MKKCYFGKTAGIAAVAAAMMMTAGMPAAAYGTQIGGVKTTTFDKYLVMDQDANVPNATFTYEITAGARKAATDTTVEILAGVNPENVTMSVNSGNEQASEGNKSLNLKFTPKDGAVETENLLVKNYDNTTEQYAAKTVTVDFTQCAFTEPGVYRYVITESGTNQAITNDADNTRFIDVYVHNNTDGTALEIAGYVLHADASDIAAGVDKGTGGAYTDGKSQGFTNEYDTSNLTIRKEVSGNQASHDKYFKFTVKITDAVAGTKYNVDLSGAEQKSGDNAATLVDNKNQNNPGSLVAGEDGTVTANFYLKHGQEVTIKGIAKDSTYTVTEEAEDYKSKAAAVENYKADTEGTIVSTDLKTSFLNTRAGVIPTGIMMAVAPFVFVTLFGGLGAAMIAMKKRKPEEE